LFPQEGYAAPTLTVFQNTLDVDINDLNGFLRKRGMEFANGYGKLKNATFRIAHMGDTQPHHLETLLANIEEYLAQR
jgi:aspartate aminotransferase-like enzyme